MTIAELSRAIMNRQEERREAGLEPMTEMWVSRLAYAQLRDEGRRYSIREFETCCGVRIRLMGS